ncbi:unnamed protein product [Darwinula stevensoni]|uniref:CARD domain-containing protein n=1 Tax=Darwinula stevensoni TaxID=69355 RepID=A0A7R8XC91_9CRUS|nr:unnamed protein product [Darwinula stevensoni]CAG0888596.1 unnamed protein product [Darwinula stevensoni]
MNCETKVSAVMAEHLKTFQQYTDLEEILLCLLMKGVIKNDEFLGLMNETREKRRKQALFLLEKIPTAGDGAFLAFLECLKKNHRKLAETLLKSLGQKNEAYTREVRAQWEGGSPLASQGVLSLAAQGIAAQPVGPSGGECQICTSELSNITSPRAYVPSQEPDVMDQFKR